MMRDQTEFNFEKFKAEAIKGLYAGKAISGSRGNFSSNLPARPFPSLTRMNLDK